MECPFQVGDEVVAVDPADGPGLERLDVGRVYVCTEIFDAGAPYACADCGSTLGVKVAGQSKENWGYCPCAFRKVQKPKTSVSIEQFLTIKPGQFEEPRRVPAKTPEKANV